MLLAEKRRKKLRRALRKQFQKWLFWIRLSQWRHQICLEELERQGCGSQTGRQGIDIESITQYELFIGRVQHFYLQPCMIKVSRQNKPFWLWPFMLHMFVQLTQSDFHDVDHNNTYIYIHIYINIYIFVVTYIYKDPPDSHGNKWNPKITGVPGPQWPCLPFCLRRRAHQNTSCGDAHA